MSKPLFVRFSKKASHWVGHPLAFVLAVLIIVAWGISGPIFGFNETWQLVINTSTTIITFLMVFLIQNTQNRDTAAIHLKLDEIVRSLQGAHNAVLDLEELSESELERLRSQYEKLAQKARAELRAGRTDIDSPPLPQSELG